MGAWGEVGETQEMRSEAGGRESRLEVRGGREGGRGRKVGTMSGRLPRAVHFLQVRRTPGNTRLLSGSRGRGRVNDLGRVPTRPASLDDVVVLKV